MNTYEYLVTLGEGDLHELARRYDLESEGLNANQIIALIMMISNAFETIANAGERISETMYL